MRKTFRWILAACLLAGSIEVPGAERTLTIATGGEGGVYHPLGVVLAALWTGNIEGLAVEEKTTGGSVENMRLVESGAAGAAFGTASVVYAAYHRTGPFKDSGKGKLLAIGALYPNAVQIVTLRKSGLRSLGDLKGKRVSVGAPGSGTEAITHDVLSAVGISYEQLGMAARVPFAETVSAVGDGRLDAASLSVGLGSSALEKLAAEHSIALVCMSPAEQDAIVAAHPAYTRYTIPQGSYSGVDYPCPTVQVANQLVVRADEDADLVYRLTKVMYENRADLAKVTPDLATLGPAYVMDATVIPLHPGALRYYREIGAVVPQRLLP